MLADIVGLIAALLALGILVHQVIEAVIAPFYDNIPALEKFKWTQIYWQFVVGAGVAFLMKLDVLPVILAQFGVIREPTFLGTALTGLLMGGGAELWHRVFDK